MNCTMSSCEKSFNIRVNFLNFKTNSFGAIFFVLEHFDPVGDHPAGVQGPGPGEKKFLALNLENN